MPNCPSNFENTQTPKFQPIYFAKKREKSREFSFGWLFWIFNFDTMFTNGLKSMRHNRWKITTAIVYPSNKWVSEWVCMRLHSIQSLSKIHQRTRTHSTQTYSIHTHEHASPAIVDDDWWIYRIEFDGSVVSITEATDGAHYLTPNEVYVWNGLECAFDLQFGPLLQFTWDHQSISRSTPRFTRDNFSIPIVIPFV